jgi:hypothetical protein
MRPCAIVLSALLLLTSAAVLAAPTEQSLVYLRTDEAGGRAFSAADLTLLAEVPGGYLGLLSADDLARLASWNVEYRVVVARDDPAYEYVVQYDAHGGRATTLPAAAELVGGGEGYRILRLPASDDYALSCLADVQRVFRRPLRFVTRPWDQPASTRTVEPDIQAIVAAVNQADLQTTVQTLQNFGTRHSQYAGGATAANWIRDQFLSYGYTNVVFQDYNTWNDNVVCTKPGSVYADKYVVIGGHYDSLNNSNPAVSPGADDNATGTACVLAAAKLMASHAFEYTLVFITFSGEEQGLYGSEAWADQAAAQGLDIIGMINLDMLGYRLAGDAADADLVANTASLPLRDLAYECLATYVPGYVAVNGSLPSGASSDHASFWNAGFRALMLFEDTGNYSPYIHTGNDLVGTSANDFAFMTNNVKLALATTAALARVFHLAIVHEPLPHQQSNGPFPITAEVIAAGALQASSLALNYRVDGGAFHQLPLLPTGQPDQFGATIPGQPRGSFVEYYLTASDQSGHTATSPLDAPTTLHGFRTGIEIAYSDDAETDLGWTFGAAGDNATSGIWLRADPVGTTYQPEDDHTADPGHVCFVTGNGAPGGGPGDQDVDGGRTTLVSPVIDLSGADWAEIAYWRWYVDATTLDDDFLVEISDDGGVTWTNLETVGDTASPWVRAAFTLPRPNVDLTAQMRLRFIASDTGGGSLVEGLIDDLTVTVTRPGGLTPVGDTPAATAALSVYPNPFNPRTTLAFVLPHAGELRLRILDPRGREVACPLAGAQPAGPGQVAWDATSLASGVYFARLELDGTTLVTQKLTLVR